ncbi:acetylglutamate kinase [Propioniciclava coleopterorum]|uniref:Acetylglutamate kinase n=1 Tax=Propioniciclava coleopterorum TaxID=2714937 RepID=A0A6G7Y994_9ACTN|nr:acetylglutamate kinase [Propioniciclava coleopterorum]QIK73218.1 acetylglutamate kinase [Propioniciclava coleopterorum]
MTPITTRTAQLQSEIYTKAGTLIEALPWLEKYAGKTIVIKYGGNAMTSDALKRAFVEDVVFLRRCGVRPVVVHGGGPQINAMLQRLDIPSEFKGGLRVTTPEAMEVVRMVLVGQVGRELVGLLNAHGPLAVGMSGEDAGLFTAQRRGTVVDGQPVDLGSVGEVVDVNSAAVADLIEAGRIPVVASVAPDASGAVLNINADTAAAALAAGLHAERLLVLTDVEGLFSNWPSTDEIIASINTTELRAILPNLSSGMIPKMEACLAAVEGGVPLATIVDGRRPHSLLLEIFTDEGVGTMVVPA